MSRVELVTAYVPLPSHPRPHEQFMENGLKLLSLGLPITIFAPDEILAEMPTHPWVTHVPFKYHECWAYPYRQCNVPFDRSTIPYRQGQDSADYHVLMHQKSTFVRMARDLHPIEPDAFAWIDFSMYHNKLLTTGATLRWYERIVRNPPRKITAPGWLDYRNFASQFDARQLQWWLLGTCLVLPEDLVVPFDDAVKEAARYILFNHEILTWEVQSWALALHHSQLPFQSYHARFDDSLQGGFGL